MDAWRLALPNFKQSRTVNVSEDVELKPGIAAEWF